MRGRTMCLHRGRGYYGRTTHKAPGASFVFVYPLIEEARLSYSPRSLSLGVAR